MDCRAFALLAALLAGTAAGGEKPSRTGSGEKLELVSGEVLVGRTLSLGGGRLSFRTEKAKREVAGADLARLVRVDGPVTARKTDGVVLTGGDVIEGQALRLRKGKLALDSPRLGELEIAAGAVRALFFGQELGGLRGRLPAAARAEVVMVTGSRTPAELRWLDGEKIGLASPLGALDVRKEDVAWLVGASPDSKAALKGATRVILTSGEILSGTELTLSGGRLNMKWQARKVAVSWDLVKRLESASGGMAYLGDLKSSGARAEAAVGPVRAPRVNLCASGEALRLGGRTREQGIGMRASSELSFELGGKWQRFRATIGLDDRAGRASRGVRFVVRVDGRKLLEKSFTPGQKPVEIEVLIKNGRKLTLALEPDAGFEIGDYGNWVDARLLR